MGVLGSATCSAAAMLTAAVTAWKVSLGPVSCWCRNDDLFYLVLDTNDLIKLFHQVDRGFGNHRAGREDGFCAAFVKGIEILWRNNTATYDQDVITVQFFQFFT